MNFEIAAANILSFLRTHSSLSHFVIPTLLWMYEVHLDSSYSLDVFSYV